MIGRAFSSFSRMTCRLLVGALLVGVSSNRVAAQSPAKTVADPASVFLSLEGTPALGDANAPIAIIEFGDYQCPYCGRHANQVFPEIVANYVKTGKVRYYFKDTPVEALHPGATKASKAALCAGEQGKYWEMHDRLFGGQALGVEDQQLNAHATAINIDVPKFQQCVNSDVHDSQLKKGIQDAVKSGARGTPTFVLGMLNPQEPAKRDVLTISGLKPYVAFQQVLDQMLSTLKPEVKAQ